MDKACNSTYRDISIPYTLLGLFLKRVLVVDNENDFRETFIKYMATEDYHGKYRRKKSKGSDDPA